MNSGLSSLELSTHFRFTRSFYALMLAQFLSALADNAMLLVCIAILIEQGESAWWVPLIKAFFTLSYVILAPWVGVMADRWPKPRIMRVANAIKLMGCLAVILATPVPLAYAFIGLGAALYAPAKYGWITEVVPAAGLVRANGWIEVSTVGAAILGVTLGGVLLGGSLTPTQVHRWVQWYVPIESVYATALVVLAILYVCPIVLTHWVKPSQVFYPAQSLRWKEALVLFVQDQRKLYADTDARISLAVTTLFWGLGAVIQLLVLQWAQESLAISLDKAAYLQGCTGVGVIIGAWMAGRWVPLERATQVLGVGVLLGCMMPMLHGIDSVPVAVATMVFVGVLSGFFVVPMNALLQYRGVQLLTAGRSIAVQNFNENASILIQTGVYAWLIYAQFSLMSMLSLFGGMTAILMMAVIWHHRQLVSSGPRECAHLR